MNRIFSIAVLLSGLFASHAFAQMNGGHGGGMMGGGWWRGMGYAWGFGIVIVILAVSIVAYLMKRK